MSCRVWMSPGAGELAAADALESRGIVGGMEVSPRAEVIQTGPAMLRSAGRCFVGCSLSLGPVLRITYLPLPVPRGRAGVGALQFQSAICNPKSAIRNAPTQPSPGVPGEGENAIMHETLPRTSQTFRSFNRRPPLFIGRSVGNHPINAGPAAGCNGYTIPNTF